MLVPIKKYLIKESALFNRSKTSAIQNAREFYDQQIKKIFINDINPPPEISINEDTNEIHIRTFGYRGIFNPDIISQLNLPKNVVFEFKKDTPEIKTDIVVWIPTAVKTIEGFNFKVLNKSFDKMEKNIRFVRQYIFHFNPKDTIFKNNNFVDASIGFAMVSMDIGTDKDFLSQTEWWRDIKILDVYTKEDIYNEFDKLYGKHMDKAGMFHIDLNKIFGSRNKFNKKYSLLRSPYSIVKDKDEFNTESKEYDILKKKIKDNIINYYKIKNLNLRC